MMKIYNFKKELDFSNSDMNQLIDPSLKEDDILCNHCKRSSTNGIRCLGMCVADNDY